MITSIEHLVAEHENILQMLAVVRQASLQVLQEDYVPAEDFREMIQFIRLYADKTHHGKEEEFLFREMVAELGELGRNLIQGGMLIEHDLGRLYVSDLEKAVNAFESDPTPDNRLDILVAAGSYANLLRRHIEKENAAVFPFGDRSLSSEALEKVEKQSAEFEADAENARIREAELATLERLKAKYL